MILKALKKLDVKDSDLSRTIKYNEEFINQLMPNLFLKGNIIEISVTTTATWFDHKLGVKPQGWIVLDKNANVNVWRLDWNNLQIRLDASGSADLKVWVF